MARGLRSAVCLLLVCGAAAAGPLKSGSFHPPRAAPDFSLTGSDGREVKLSSFRGKVVALGFGYTFCPDVCPTTLADLAQVHKKLGGAAKDFQVIYVTVDPERDSAQHLRKYLAVFHPGFIGATGSEKQLADVRRDYGIQIARKPFAPDSPLYVIHHSSFVYLIDRAGRLVAMKPFGEPLDDIADDVLTLLGK
jgi:protein SCO1